MNGITVDKNKLQEIMCLDYKPEFSVEDKVRIGKEKKSFFTGYYTMSWSKKVFIVSEVKHTSPKTYKIKDLNGKKNKR